MNQVHAIRVHRHGGPEELRYEPVEVGHPGPGEARRTTGSSILLP